MAELIFFHFVPGTSFLYKRNLLFKLASFILVTASLFTGSGIISVFTGFLIIVTAIITGENPIKLIWRLRFYFPFLVFIFFFELLSTSQNAGPMGWLDWDKLPEALLQVYRFLLAMILSHLLLKTSSTRDFRDQLFYAFRFLSVKLADRLALMVTMTLHFIPMFMDEAKALITAATSRCARKKPGFRMILKVLSLPLLLQVLMHSEQTAIGLMARGYNENQTRNRLNINSGDFVMLIISVILLTAALLFRIDSIPVQTMISWFKNLK